MYKGKRRESFGAAVTTPLQADTKRQLLIAIVPLDSGSISDAEKVRVTISGFGVFASRVDTNPLRKMGIGGPVGTAESVGDGVFNLIGGYQGNSIVSPVSNAARIVSLKIEPSRE